MFTPLMLAALSSVALVQDTDTTIAAERGTRLELHNHRGAVVVRSWTRDAVRIRAEHDDDDSVAIDRAGALLRVRSRRRFGTPGEVEFTVTVPRWMAVDIDGFSNDVEVDGVAGEVTVKTVRGDARVTGAEGYVDITSVDGEVVVRDARGTIRAHTVNDDVRIDGATGEVGAETVNGDVLLTAVRSGEVSATTVNGDITYRGGIHDDGRYRFATHNGDIVVTVPRRTHATVSVSTFGGEFEADFPVQLTEIGRGRRLNFVLGEGGARLEIEAFQGNIRLERPERGATQED